MKKPKQTPAQKAALKLIQQAKEIKERDIDGVTRKEIERIRRAVREVWMWTSFPRRLCLKRAMHADGFPRCEACKEKVVKVYADHIHNVGDVDAGFIDRMWVSSKNLQAICKKCHDRKTREERAQLNQRIPFTERF